MASKRRSGKQSTGQKSKSGKTDDDPNIGLLTKLASAESQAKWLSPGKIAKKTQISLFGSGCLEILSEAAMIGKEVLFGGEIYPDGVPL